MVIRIGSNVDSLTAQRTLSRESSTLEKIQERLSSGMRINRASDDAAGLAIATGLNASARVYGAGIRNLNDGISAVNIADGAVRQLETVLERLRELATQASNGAFNRSQHLAMDGEAYALTGEYNRIIGSTAFNGVKLLDGSNSELRVQAGVGTQESLGITTDQGLQGTVGDGTFTVSQTGLVGYQTIATGDVNKDGKTDIIAASDNWIVIDQNQGGGQFTNPFSINTVISSGDVQVTDYNNDGNLDIFAGGVDGTLRIYKGQGSVTYSGTPATSIATGMSSISNVRLGDLNGDGNADIVVTGAVADQQMKVYLGDGRGGFQQSAAVTVPYTLGHPNLTALADMNGDGALDVVESYLTGGTPQIYLGDGKGSFSGVVTLAASGAQGGAVVGDFNHDGLNDLVNTTGSGLYLYINGGNNQYTMRGIDSGYVAYNMRTLDINGDGNLDIYAAGNGSGTAHILLGRGDGSFDVTSTSAITTYDLEFADFNGDGVPDRVARDSTTTRLQVDLGTATTTRTIQRLDLTTREGALAAIGTIDAALQRIQSSVGNLGSFQSRMESNLRALSARRDRNIEAASRITDADIASESAEMVKRQIVQQMASAVLSQANQTPALALQLLNAR